MSWLEGGACASWLAVYGYVLALVLPHDHESAVCCDELVWADGTGQCARAGIRLACVIIGVSA